MEHSKKLEIISTIEEKVIYAMLYFLVFISFYCDTPIDRMVLLGAGAFGIHFMNKLTKQ